MPWRALAVLLLLVCTSTGCWVDACTYGTPRDPGECAEQWDGVFAPSDDEGFSDWCGGELHVFKSCNDLGYTLHCGDRYYMPGTQAAMSCQAQH